MTDIGARLHHFAQRKREADAAEAALTSAQRARQELDQAKAAMRAQKPAHRRVTTAASNVTAGLTESGIRVSQDGSGISEVWGINHLNLGVKGLALIGPGLELRDDGVLIAERSVLGQPDANGVIVPGRIRLDQLDWRTATTDDYANLITAWLETA